jgi:hypothetical protein
MSQKPLQRENLFAEGCCCENTTPVVMKILSLQEDFTQKITSTLFF